MSNFAAPVRYSGMNTTERLAAYAQLLNRYGPNSKEAADFIAQNIADAEFCELAALSRFLKIALCRG